MTAYKMKYDFNNVLSQFDLKGKLVSCEPYGEGHINETYLATFDDNGKTVRYIVQKINTGLFKDVDKLMHNIVSVTNFARERIIAKGGDPDRESLTVVFTKGGKPYYYDEASKGTFRVYIFITDAVAYQIVEKPEHFYQSALAFGNFANLLADFDASKLYEILPDFHNTEKRFNDFLTSVKNDKFGRFKTYARGYLEALGNSVTKIEKDNLTFGAILMTYECGMRFLADYLDGDVYFRTHREGHNLDRARTQIKLVSDMEACFDRMKDITKKY